MERERSARREPRNGGPSEEREPHTLAAPVLGMACSSLVVVAVVAVLNSQVGRDIEEELAAPARALIAVPAVTSAIVAFCASMVALLPTYRRPALQVAAIAGWVVAAWLVMGAMILAAIKFATERVS